MFRSKLVTVITVVLFVFGVAMKKTSMTRVLAFTILLAFASVAISQAAEKAWENTVTLPSDEVILDMNGEWDDIGEGYGIFSPMGESPPEILTITQDGNTFTAIKQIGSKWIPKGAETIKGELDKDGFKVVYAYIGSKAMDGSFDWEECKWEISENGNKIALDCGERVKRTLTRK